MTPTAFGVGPRPIRTLDCHVDSTWILSEMAQATECTVSPDRMNFGGLDAVTLALYISDPWQDQLGFARVGTALAKMVKLAQKHFPNRHFLAMEGGRLLGPDIFPRLHDFAILGIKYLTLVHNFNTTWAGSATDPKDPAKGLTATGKQVISVCEDLDVLVDVSHSSDSTITDVMFLAQKPVIASHSGCRARLHHPRNLTDNQIKQIAATDGVIHVPFAKRFVGHTEGIAEHIDHINQLTASCLHVGIGSDLDGAVMCDGITGAESWADAAIVPLLKRGYSEDQIRLIAGGNTLRVFDELPAVGKAKS